MIRKSNQAPSFSKAFWLALALLSGEARVTEAFSWDDMSILRESIVEPTFPDREFPVTDYGAVPDGRTDSTQAFRDAIRACAQAGGGRVVARGGVFRTGPIHLKSGVNLHVAEKTTLSFYTDPEKFLPPVLTRYEGVELINYSPLIYAYGQKNVALTGKGTLDGNAGEDNWWKMTPPRSKNEDPDNPHTRTILFQMAEDGVPVEQRNFGRESQLRPTFVEFYECENILVEDVTILNAPFWMIHPVLSRNMTIRGVTCDSSGPNNDGVDPESSENILIEHCVFHTKDDGVAIKAGRNADGRRVNRPSRNIIITDCVMNTRHTAVAIGSEMTGGVENVYAQNLVCGEIQRVFRIKTNSMRGGFVRHIGMRNVRVKEATGTLIDFRTNYGRETGPYFPEVGDIVLQDIICQRADQAISFKGTEDMPFRGARLERIQVKAVQKPSVFHHVQDLAQDAVEIGEPPAAATRFEIDISAVVGPNTEFWKAAGHDYMFHYANTPIGRAFLNRAEARESLRYFRAHFTFNTTESDDVPGVVVGGDVATIRPDGSVCYDFSRVNRTFREYVKRGMKPIVEFGFFPEGFARDFGPPRADNRGGEHEREAVPRDWDRWEALQHAFIKNLEEEFRKEELRTWYFEVWNEPDQWPREHLDVFFRMYDLFAHVVKSYDSGYRVGGPGSYTQPFLNRFLEQVEHGTNYKTGKTGSPLDFVSHHIYGTSGKWLNQSPALQPRVSFFVRELLYLNRILENYPRAKQAEFLLDEWGLSSRFRRTVDRFPDLEFRNNHESPLFLVKLVDQLFALSDSGSLKTDLLLYWGFTWEAERDWIFRGNRELLTGGEVAKPMLHGFELLARLLADRLAVLGPPPGGLLGILPTREGDQLAVILYNFDSVQPSSGSREEVSLEIGGLNAGGRLRWEVTPLDQTRNNSYARWKQAGSPVASSINPDMATEWNRLVPSRTGVTPIRSGHATFRFSLPPQSMVLLETTIER